MAIISVREGGWLGRIVRWIGGRVWGAACGRVHGDGRRTVAHAELERVGIAGGRGQLDVLAPIDELRLGHDPIIGRGSDRVPGNAIVVQLLCNFAARDAPAAGKLRVMGKRRMHILRSARSPASSGQAVTLSEADLRGIASSYDEGVFKAPIVVGHPNTNHPAYGWVRELEFADGGVFATPRDVEPQFAEMVRKGRFRKISASLYLPGNPQHPVEGATSPYVRHVGFLGAQAPAIQGLEEASLAEDSGAVIIEIELAEPDTSLPTRLANPPREADDVKSIEQQNAELAEREEAVEAREKKLKKAAGKARLKGHQEFAEQLGKDGRILPRHTATVVALLAALPADTQVEFAESADADGEDMPAADALQKLLGELPKQVDYAERAGADRKAPGKGTAEFTSAEGAPVSEERMVLHRKVLDFAEKHNVGYDEALTKVAAQS